MSRVERCGTPCTLATCMACVPFPAPGGPRKISARLVPCDAMTAPPQLSAATAQPALLHKTFVMAHDELRLDLLHGVHGHADDDAQRRAADIKSDAEAFKAPTRG